MSDSAGIFAPISMCAHSSRNARVAHIRRGGLVRMRIEYTHLVSGAHSARASAVLHACDAFAERTHHRGQKDWRNGVTS